MKNDQKVQKEKTKGRVAAKKALIEAINSCGIENLHVQVLNVLPGSFVNLEYRLSNGQTVKLLEDDKMSWGNQVARPGNARCLGLAAEEGYRLVCEYGCAGADPEIILYRKRQGQGRS